MVHYKESNHNRPDIVCAYVPRQGESNVPMVVLYLAGLTKHQFTVGYIFVSMALTKYLDTSDLIADRTDINHNCSMHRYNC
jgi:hypothetical protein